jgi:hypothetical protein
VGRGCQKYTRAPVETASCTPPCLRHLRKPVSHLLRKRTVLTLLQPAFAARSWSCPRHSLDAVWQACLDAGAHKRHGPWLQLMLNAMECHGHDLANMRISPRGSPCRILIFLRSHQASLPCSQRFPSFCHSQLRHQGYFCPLFGTHSYPATARASNLNFGT